jgi:hypothetical protein
MKMIRTAMNPPVATWPRRVLVEGIHDPGAVSGLTTTGARAVPGGGVSLLVDLFLNVVDCRL